MGQGVSAVDAPARWIKPRTNTGVTLKIRFRRCCRMGRLHASFERADFLFDLLQDFTGFDQIFHRVVVRIERPVLIQVFDVLPDDLPRPSHTAAGMWCS